MKVVILAGGLGTRISEETSTRPKPMVEIGGRPILWHIMKSYAHYGLTDFVVCCGYKGYMIKEYFANYLLHMSDVSIDLVTNSIEIHNKHTDAWRVTLVDTGDQTQTGGRLRRVAPYLGDEFCMTYGDGLSNIDIRALVAFHRAHGKLATMSAVQPPGRFGAMQLDGSSVTSFIEKPRGDTGWINGGFFVLSKQVLPYIENDLTPWESKPLDSLVREKQLVAFTHQGFWQPMDTLRDKVLLEDLWQSGKAPWKCWE